MRPMGTPIPANARSERPRTDLTSLDEVEGLVDCMVRGGSSPLGRTGTPCIWGWFLAAWMHVRGDSSSSSSSPTAPPTLLSISNASAPVVVVVAVSVASTELPLASVTLTLIAACGFEGRTGGGVASTKQSVRSAKNRSYPAGPARDIRAVAADNGPTSSLLLVWSETGQLAACSSAIRSIVGRELALRPERRPMPVKPPKARMARLRNVTRLSL